MTGVCNNGLKRGKAKGRNIHTKAGAQRAISIKFRYGQKGEAAGGASFRYDTRTKTIEFRLEQPAQSGTRSYGRRQLSF